MSRSLNPHQTLSPDRPPKGKNAGQRPLFSISEARRQLTTGRISARELLAEHQRIIAEHNGPLNALPTLCLARAEEEADRLDKTLAAQRAGRKATGVGPLAGMAYCAKDMFDSEGVRTTYGSPIFANRIPEKDAEIVRRIRQAGALLIGKSNTPEFAAGSQTFNKVFGATRNPWSTGRTCGGSTGGGAVALATNMVMLADGSDLAASLRNPASFCSVTGLRPSSHLEPRLQTGLNPFNTLSMVGPMARTIADLRECFLAIFDPEGCAPNRTLQAWVELRDAQARQRAAIAAGKNTKHLRLGWAPDWGGLPVQQEVAAQMQACADQLSAKGITLVTGFPKLPDVRQAFLTLRGQFFVAEFGELYAHHRAELKDTVIWNIEQGMRITAPEIARAEKIRALARTRIEEYMQEHQLDALAGPTNQVLPFDLETPYITNINGIELDTYIDWLASNFIFTVAGMPALSLPAGFAKESATGALLPLGLQLVGRWADDMALMDTAERIESILSLSATPC
ncbi:MAG: amidase [Burkholderiaceae bacterium]|nr:amidase [Burkholderiaceae bacterium]